VPYPIPVAAIWQPHWIQGGWPGYIDHREEDRHIFIFNRDNNLLYELWSTWFDPVANQWYAGSGAVWDTTQNELRHEGWTSSDASGMAHLPGVLRYDEVYGPDEINHALGITVRATNGHVFPATHSAGTTVGALPMGARLRLKSTFEIPTDVSPECQKIYRGLKNFGGMINDNGGDLDLDGSFDTRWNNDIMNPCFHRMSASDFEVVQVGWRP
jgi:hypothetical protein